VTLSLHAGAEAIEYGALRDLPIPAATSTHVPIPHHRVVDTLVHTLSFYGHEVVDQHHGITKDGLRYFGLLSLRSTYGDYEDTIGLRNSHDKSFPIGVAIGGKIFCCDNLSFIGDHVIKRKHTANAKRDLPGLIGEIIEPLTEQREAQHRTFERYKTAALTDGRADQAIMQMYRQNVIGVQRIADLVEQWERPAHPWSDKKDTCRLFNAATYALAGRVAENPGVTRALHQVIDGVCETVQ
jgi:hypothetical protein